MPFVPHTQNDVHTMLERIGASTVEELFDEIDARLRGADFRALPEGESEMTMLAELSARARRDETGPCFLGAGCYDHHIPAAVWDLAGRGEFLTAYTPYQAEASQGTLQLIYEYQSMMAALTGLEVSNASVYDGGSALAEAVLMAVRKRGRRRPATEDGTVRVAVPGACHPLYVDAARSIVRNQGIELVETGCAADGTAALDALDAAAQSGAFAAVVVQQPNFFGVIEPVDKLVAWAEDQGAATIAVVNPVALGLLKPPGEWNGGGVDIACGDGQPLGVPMASGGPSFGFLCTRLSHVRQMPGRLVGRTLDSAQKPGFTLTLQAREQHIRRGKATSNICTNQGLLVTAATIHMALLGARGLRTVASACHQRTRELVAALTTIDGVRQRFAAPFFHECVLDIGRPADAVVAALATSGVVGGLPLGRYRPELANCLLVCATEKRTAAEIQMFRDALAPALRPVECAA